jgi:hypothetical protein
VSYVATGAAAGCPSCTFLVGGDCVPCPAGADFPECANCSNEQPTQIPSAMSFWTTVAIGFTTMMLVTVGSRYMLKKLKLAS